MRKIKFRGKRLDTGEWIYGYLVSGNYEPQRKNYTKAWIMHFGRLQGTLKKQEVDPKTVGQYIGLKDKNGREIYAGDLFSGWDNRSYYVVDWNEQSTGFRLVWIKGSEADAKWHYYFEMSMAEYQFEPAGNIHDNPELLK